MDQQPEQVPQVTEALAPPAPVQPAVKQETTAGQLILGWLTYALWGWTILALSILLGTVIASLIGSVNTSGFTPYGIAAVVVLLPIAAICDYFYSKHEPNKKTGGALIIMVVHAIIFALFCIGSLIGAVFSVVQLLVSKSDSTATTVALLSTLITSVLYAAAFVRTLDPKKPRLLKKAYTLFMIIITVVAIVLAIVGPISYERSTRDDRLISENISSLQQLIDDHASNNNKLPTQLSDVNASGNTQKLVESDLIKYSANTQEATTRSSSYSSSATKTFYYKLCVNYKKRSGSSNTVDTSYTSYVSAYSHPAGEVCYNLKTSGYSSNY